MQLANGEFRYAQYDHFSVEHENDNYKLRVEEFRGNAGNIAVRYSYVQIPEYEGPYLSFIWVYVIVIPLLSMKLSI